MNIDDPAFVALDEVAAIELAAPIDELGQAVTIAAALLLLGSYGIWVWLDGRSNDAPEPIVEPVKKLLDIPHSIPP